MQDLNPRLRTVISLPLWLPGVERCELMIMQGGNTNENEVAHRWRTRACGALPNWGNAILGAQKRPDFVSF